MTVGNVSVWCSRGGGCCVIVINSPQRLTPNGDPLGSSVVPAVTDPGSHAPDGRRDVGVIPLTVGGTAHSPRRQRESRGFTCDPRSHTALPSHQSVTLLLTLSKWQVDHVDPW